MPIIETPEDLICPITKSIFKNPVVASSGHSYSQVAFDQLLRTSPAGQRKDPMTNLPLTDAKYVPNHHLNSRVKEFLSKDVISRATLHAKLEDGDVKGLKSDRIPRVIFDADDTNNSAFVAAVDSDNIDCVRWISEIIDMTDSVLSSKSEHGSQTPLMHLLWVEQNPDTKHQMLLVLMENKECVASINCQSGNNGSTALHHARTASAIRLLVSKGADVNACDSNGDTPLLEAGLDLPCITALIECGADIMVISEGTSLLANSTAMPITAYKKVCSYYTASQLKKMTAGDTFSSPLHMACSHGSPEVLAFVIDNSPKNEMRCKVLCTRLVMVSANPSKEKLQLLLDRKICSIDERDTHEHKHACVDHLDMTKWGEKAREAFVYAIEQGAILTGPPSMKSQQEKAAVGRTMKALTLALHARSQDAVNWKSVATDTKRISDSQSALLEKLGDDAKSSDAPGSVTSTEALWKNKLKDDTKSSGGSSSASAASAVSADESSPKKRKSTRSKTEVAKDALSHKRKKKN